MKMKKKIAIILRRLADKISPEGKYLPPLNCKVGELKLLCVGYQYPKDAKMLDFDMIRYRLTQLIAKDLVCNRAILFTINDGDSYINTIEAKLYVKRPENVDGYEEI